MHIPVLLNESIKYLSPKKRNVIVDATFGEGGHSQKILKKILPSGKLVAIDIDEEAIKKGKKKFKRYSKNIVFVNENFKNIKKILENLKIKQVDGILLDLGFSLRQVEEKKYGLSFQKEMPLDMRLSSSIILTAKMIVNKWPQKDLIKIFKEYGEERFSQKIAQRIVEERKRKEIETTFELSEIVKKAISRRFWPKKIHPATKVFQALRIAVNEEFKNLKIFLENFPSILKENGRLVIISYHSGEDRLVKNIFKELKRKKEIEILTKKPIRPKKEEITKNPRARSAKMRVCKKLKTN